MCFTSGLSLFLPLSPIFSISAHVNHLKTFYWRGLKEIKPQSVLR